MYLKFLLAHKEHKLGKYNKLPLSNTTKPTYIFACALNSIFLIIHIQPIFNLAYVICHQSDST